MKLTKLNKVYTLSEILVLQELELIPDNTLIDCIYTISNKYKFIYKYKVVNGKLRKWNSLTNKYSVCQTVMDSDFTHGKASFFVYNSSESL